MMTVILVLHFMVCFVLITVVLLQRGKGADLGAALGGGGVHSGRHARPAVGPRCCPLLPGSCLRVSLCHPVTLSGRPLLRRLPSQMLRASAVGVGHSSPRARPQRPHRLSALLGEWGLPTALKQMGGRRCARFHPL